MRSESGIWIWSVVYRFQKYPYSMLQIFNSESRKIHTQLSRYGMPHCVIQIPHLSLVKYGNICLGQQCFLKPYTTRAFLKPYTTRAAPSWCMVSKTPSWCMVSKNTAHLKRYFHSSPLKCVVSTINLNKQHIGNTYLTQ